LLDKVGFARFHPQQVARAGQEFGKANVAGGAFDAHAITPRAMELPLRRGERIDGAPRVSLFQLRAPVQKGQIIGSLAFYEGDRKIAEVPLEAREAVPVGLATKVFPPARVLPSNPPYRFLIYACAAGSLALFLIYFKLRSQETKPTKLKGATHDKRTETRAEFYARLEAERETRRNLQNYRRSQGQKERR
jgi:hypothetical protein